MYLITSINNNLGPSTYDVTIPQGGGVYKIVTPSDVRMRGGGIEKSDVTNVSNFPRK